MPVYNKSDAVASGNISLPRNRYTLRVLEANFKPSSKGNPMVELQCEVLHQNKETIIEDMNGQKIDISGTRVRYYIVFSPGSLSIAFDALTKFGYAEPTIDTDNFDCKWLVGKVFDAILQSRQEPQRQQGKGGKLGEPILDGEGKQILRNVVDAQLTNILKLNDDDGGRPY